MNAGMSTQPIAVIDLVLTQLNDQHDGTWTAEASGLRDPADGQLKYGTVSVQETLIPGKDGEPDDAVADIQWRPLGTNGAFERFLRLDGNRVLFSPRGTKGYVFAFVEGLPNS